MPLDSLFGAELTEAASSYWTSVAVPLAVVTLLAVIGAVLRSRIMLGAAWLVGMATVVLWLVMRRLVDMTDLGLGDLESGFWVALLGLAVMLIGITGMGPRPAREEAEDEEPSLLESEFPEPPSTTNP
jgi:uncharacterized membrane protein YhaH (DUF805 family)